jgi:hypothetical protein
MTLSKNWNKDSGIWLLHFAIQIVHFGHQSHIYSKIVKRSRVLVRGRNFARYLRECDCRLKLYFQTIYFASFNTNKFTRIHKHAAPRGKHVWYVWGDAADMSAWFRLNWFDMCVDLIPIPEKRIFSLFVFTQSHP